MFHSYIQSAYEKALYLIQGIRVEENELREIKRPSKRSYKTQMLLGILGGLILFIVGAVGSVGIYGTIINYAIQNNILPREYGALVLGALLYLAAGGGLTVILGSLIIPKVRRLGNWLINIGAGVSLGSLLTRIYFLGPVIQSYISRAYENISYLIQGIRILGIEIGIVGIGVLLAFLATFERYKWTIVIGTMAFFSMLTGLSADPRIFEYIKSSLGIPPQYGVYVDYTVTFLLYVGAVLLVDALIAGAGFVKIAKIIVVLSMLATIFSLISVILDLTSLTNFMSLTALLQYLRILCAILTYALGIYFIKNG